MAHPVIVAQRQAIAYQRLIQAADKLRKPYGVSEQVDALKAINSKDPSYQQMLQSEALADLIEALTKGGKATSKEPPLTVETVEKKPMVTTETAEIVNDGTDTVIDVDLDAIPLDVDHVDLLDGSTLDRVKPKGKPSKGDKNAN